jgi:transposase
LALITKGEDERIPPPARECLMALAAQLERVKRQILGADRRVLAWHRSSQISKRLEAIPGVSPLIATALVARIPDPGAFRSGRDLSARIGLVPKQHSTGGKERLGSISGLGLGSSGARGSSAPPACATMLKTALPWDGLRSRSRGGWSWRKWSTG